MVRDRTTLLMCFCIAVGVATPGCVYAADPAVKVERLSVTNARPVWVALQKLSNDGGYLLTYEDPIYLYREDMENVSGQGRRREHDPGQLPVISPKNGTLTINYEVSADGKPRDILDVVNKLVQADASRIGNRFTFFQDGEFIHVIPTRTRNAKGEWMIRQSVLDTRINISVRQRTVAQLFEAICRELGTQIGITVNASFYPLNAFIGTQTSLGADNEMARDVVVRMLGIFKRRLTWSLNYDPMLRNYYFNIEVIANPANEARKVEPASPTTNNEPTPMGRQREN